MSVNAGHGRLTRASKELVARWNDATLWWHDENRRLFEERFLNDLLARLRTAEKAMGHMDTILASVRRDCGDDT